ncbi:hypothetical protein AB0N06_07805 [Streptomyces sp. NPDC051020]|jgi:hypothetical protein|uniref:hypothetical protein n=1 Tax=Streptomyces sp. NPDC051020 TaxID=3155409 RepID=UPI00343E9576
MDTATEVVVMVRRRGVGEVVECAWPAASTDLLSAAAPWRTFRWFKGQKHYLGIYRSATTNDQALVHRRGRYATV